MEEDFVLLVDCNENIARQTITSKIYPLCSTLVEKYKLHICFLLSTKKAQENYKQLSKELERWPYTEHTVQTDSKPKSLFWAKRYIDDNDLNNILLLSFASSFMDWKGFVSVLFTASVYKINFQCLDLEPVNEIPLDPAMIQVECRKMLSTIDTEESVKILRSDLIPEDIFYHGFSTRLGGVSSIRSLKSLNLYYTSAKRDPKIVIEENIRRLAKKAGFQAESLQVAKVEHGKAVWELSESPPENYDALITHESQYTIAVPGADCLLLLFADPFKKICAAAHSGWKGTMLQVAKEVVQKMVHLGSDVKDIRVAMGPGVEARCFSISPDHVAMVDKSFSDCLIPLKNSEKVGLDLFKANRIILEKNGIFPQNIDTESVGLCTVCNQDLFYSYERDKKPFGNQMGYIGIRK